MLQRRCIWSPFLRDGVALVYVAFCSEAGTCLDYTLAQGAGRVRRKGYNSALFAPVFTDRIRKTRGDQALQGDPLLAWELVWRC